MRHTRCPLLTQFSGHSARVLSITAFMVATFMDAVHGCSRPLKVPFFYFSLRSAPLAGQHQEPQHARGAAGPGRGLTSPASVAGLAGLASLHAGCPGTSLHDHDHDCRGRGHYCASTNQQAPSTIMAVVVVMAVVVGGWWMWWSWPWLRLVGVLTVWWELRTINALLSWSWLPRACLSWPW